MKTNAIVIRTKKRIFTSLLGRNLSKFKGNGLDFKEFREYVYGEDSKKIDWKIYAKTKKPFVKEYEEERELRILIAVLKSGSLYFGSKKLKTETVAEIIAALALGAVYEDNRVSCMFLGKDKKLFKPTKNKKSVYSFVEYALKTDYLKENYTQSDIEFLNSLKKSILFLIGDFYNEIDPSLLKHETYVINVRDRFEEDPLFFGNVEVIDPVTFESINVNFNASAKKTLKNRIEKQEKKLIRLCKKHKIPYTKIYTDEEPVYKLVKLVR